MEFSQSEDNQEVTLSKFESMLKTNSVFFFDSNEFENIIHHYLESGKIALAKKAIKLGLSQHPASLNLKLFQVEILIFENKLNEADRLLSPLFEIEPNNEELYIQKANIRPALLKVKNIKNKEELINSLSRVSLRGSKKDKIKQTYKTIQTQKMCCV